MECESKGNPQPENRARTKSGYLCIFSNSDPKKDYSFMPNSWCTRKLWRTLRSNMISSLPPGIA